MKTINMCAALLVMVACGTADDGDDELGTVQQAVGLRFSPSFGYGVSTALSRLSCTPTNLSQSCIVPVKKTGISWCIDAPTFAALTANQKADITNAFNAVQNNPTGFAFTHTADGSSCVSQNIVINGANSGFCSGGSTSSQIDAYVCNNPSIGAQLSEVPFSVPGNYFPGLGQGGTAFIHLDLTDISTKCAGDVFACSAMLKHGVAHSVMNLCGAGTRTDRTDLWTSRAVLPYNDARLVSSGEKCRMLAFNQSNPTNVTIVDGPACPTD